MLNNARLFAALLLTTMLLFGCSDDEVIGTGLDVEGLKLPASINVIPPKKENSDSALMNINGLNQALFSDAGTDYSNDTTTTTTESELQLGYAAVNFVFCLLDKLKLDVMVNKGPYTALISEDGCFSENTSSTVAPSYILVTAISERKSNQSPQTIKVWIEDMPDDELHKNAILSDLVIYEGNILASVSAEKPFGDFTLTASYSEDAVILGGIAGEEVTLDSFTAGTDYSVDNEPQFKHISEYYLRTPESTSQGIYAGNITLNSSDHQQGKALNKTDITFGETNFYQALASQFDNNNAMQGRDSDRDNIFESQSCSSRSQFSSNVGEYWLYHELDGIFRGNNVTAGERINFNTSKQVSYQGSNGYLSYGSYFVTGDAIPDGTIVSDSNGSESYSLHISPGDLSIHSSTDILLSNLENSTLSFYARHPDPTIESYGYAWWLVRVVANEFLIEAVYDISSGNTSTTIDHDNDSTTTELPVAATLSFINGELEVFSDLERVNTYNYNHDSAVPTAERTISKSLENIFLLSSDPLIANGPVTLYCYTRCPIGGLDQLAVDNAVGFTDLYYVYWSFTGTAYEYSLSNDNHKTVLTDVSNGQIVDVTGLTPTTAVSSVDLSFLYSSGHLLTQALNEPATYAQLDEIKDYYIWSTGNSTRHHLVTLVDSSGNDVIFDRPLNFSYLHDAANDRNNTDPITNPYHDKLFTFSDGSFSATIDANGNYRPPFSILDGTQFSNVEGDFIVKAKGITQALQDTSLNQCGGLNIDNIFFDPSMALLTVDDIVPVTLKRSDKPIVTDPPAIIDGVVQ